MKGSRKISVIKTFSWRLVATTITAGLGYLFTGSWVFAASIGAADTVVKLGTYYLHERLWERIIRRDQPSEHRAQEPCDSP